MVTSKIDKITLSEKCDSDWRAEIEFIDSEKNMWYMRCSGDTPKIALSKILKCYSDEDSWDSYGWIIE